jgi:pimeloyl-ACP methyl ester carboxylesterase
MRRAFAFAAVAFALWWAVGLASAWWMTRAHPTAVPTRAAIGEWPVESIETKTIDGVEVRGWLVRAGPASVQCVVLAAGIHGCRLAMVERAKWYLAHGWSALLVDLRGTGASDPARIAMGWHEALDLAAWAAFARAHGFVRVGVHGQSLGAAAAVYTAVRNPEATAWHFAVLEQCYRDIDAALAARLPYVPAPLLWPLATCAEWLLGVDRNDLAPVRAIAQLRAPTFFACGDADEKVGEHATADLFAASRAAVKERCVVPGIGHGDLWAAGDVLHHRLAEFLAAR